MEIMEMKRWLNSKRVSLNLILTRIWYQVNYLVLSQIQQRLKISFVNKRQLRKSQMVALILFQNWINYLIFIQSLTLRLTTHQNRNILILKWENMPKKLLQFKLKLIALLIS